ncbi:hypothetical protein sphantq_01975 [Sphingobium sp. AntQ-1]|uniref:hypothetical protein n=1 Tax=Sphingobium sp. AntQ-1 TaxID=2930091 RepID=UPI00234ED7FB|nr:hypothetical protein [Sphingobium sp. AntQ-1]WCP13546.1 hypothetical protein sphantq_01975 [Sphingobium sp. AntQ-1]
MGKYAPQHERSHADTPICEFEPTKKESSPERKRKPPAIKYHRPPRDRAERQQRIEALQQYSQEAGLPWNALTPTEREKKIQFGTCARARNPGRAKHLCSITGKILEERIARYRHGLSAQAARQLDIQPGLRTGNLRGCDLDARATLMFALASVMRRFFRRNKHLNFYFLTFIHDDWHRLSSHPVLPLDDIRSRLRNLMQGKGLEWIATIEVDALKNVPRTGKDRWLIPHVHMIAWTEQDWRPSDLADDLAASGRLVCATGAETVVGRRIQHRHTLSHLCYYLLKPPYQCKSRGFDTKKGRHRLYHVLKYVPAHLSIAMCRMLSSVHIKQLMMVSGQEAKAVRRHVMVQMKQIPARQRR